MYFFPAGVGAIAKLVGPGADIAEAAVAKRKQCHNHMSKEEMEKCITHNEGVDKTSGIINGVKAGEKVITTAVDIYNTFKEGLDAIEEIDKSMNESENLYNE